MDSAVMAVATTPSMVKGAEVGVFCGLLALHVSLTAE
jgi:hypothetical protein